MTCVSTFFGILVENSKFIDIVLSIPEWSSIYNDEYKDESVCNEEEDYEILTLMLPSYHNLQSTVYNKTHIIIGVRLFSITIGYKNSNTSFNVDKFDEYKKKVDECRIKLEEVLGRKVPECGVYSV